MHQNVYTCWYVREATERSLTDVLRKWLHEEYHDVFWIRIRPNLWQDAWRLSPTTRSSAHS